MKLQQVTWIPAALWILTPVIFLGLALHVRVGLGHWPKPLIERYETSAYQSHELVLEVVANLAIFTGGIWLLAICFKKTRPAWRTLLPQIILYLAGLGIYFLFRAINPGHFFDWYLQIGRMHH